MSSEGRGPFAFVSRIRAESNPTQSRKPDPGFGARLWSWVWSCVVVGQLLPLAVPLFTSSSILQSEYCLSDTVLGMIVLLVKWE